MATTPTPLARGDPFLLSLKKVRYGENCLIFLHDSYCKEHDCRIITIAIEGQSTNAKILSLGYKCVHDLRQLLELILQELPP